MKHPEQNPRCIEARTPANWSKGSNSSTTKTTKDTPGPLRRHKVILSITKIEQQATAPKALEGRNTKPERVPPAGKPDKSEVGPITDAIEYQTESDNKIIRPGPKITGTAS